MINVSLDERTVNLEKRADKLEDFVNQTMTRIDLMNTNWVR